MATKSKYSWGAVYSKDKTIDHGTKMVFGKRRSDAERDFKTRYPDLYLVRLVKFYA